MNKVFNIVISGVGGQGLITLNQIIAQAAMIEGFDVKTSELHGLSQRGGSVQTHIRFGKKVFSPLVALGRADLVLSLEVSETLRVVPYAGKNTIYLVNKFYFPYPQGLSEKEVIGKLNRIAKKRLDLISASEICQKELGNEVVSGVYLLSWAVFKKIIPLKPNSVLKGISEVVPKKYFELNKKAFDLAQKL